MGQRVSLCYVATALADHNNHLAFVVELFGCFGPDQRRIVTDKASREPDEQRRVRRGFLPIAVFLVSRGEIHADADDFFR